MEQNILALSSLVFGIHVELSCCLALSVGTLVNPPSVGSEEAYLCAIQTVFSFSPSKNLPTVPIWLAILHLHRCF